MSDYGLIIDGNKLTTKSSFDVINPAAGKSFAKCQNADISHVDLAVAAAVRAFPKWRDTPDAERQFKIHELATILESHMPELMELVTKETGKPLGGLNGVGSGMEVGGAAAWTHVTADLDLPIEIIQDNEEARIEVHHKPLGVVGSITPWNWPLLIAIWHIMPALRVGNAVVIKPSPYAPIAICRFVELANDVLPSGVLNVVTGGSEIGTAITEHKDIAKIIFTGSTSTGKKIMSSAAGNLKRLTLELGGNDAGIVLPDVNVSEIAPKILAACFHNNGQTCAALKRLYIHEDIYDELCEKIAELAKELIVGDGLKEDTQLGPLQNKEQLEIVKELADDAVAQGGLFLTGGNVSEGDGYFFEPTIVTNIKEGVRLVDEEPFGPIVPLIKYSDIDEVIKRANTNENGLGGSVWSTDVNKATELALQLECGSAWVNEHGAIQPDAPFGGVKQSGFGVEFGVYGLKEYTSIQTLKIMK